MAQTRSKSAPKEIADNPPTPVVASLAQRSHGQSFQLNFDVLLLLASHANPLDILNLARTCKHFRELLMDKSSTLIWKTARTKIEGMPDCPADLTEQEYTDLALCARCRGCGGYATDIFWEMRLRYCPDCKAKRLRHLPSCPEIVQRKYVLGMGHVSVGEETPLCVDGEQMELFMNEYKFSSESDKKRLLNDRQERLVAIRNHARKCEIWQRRIDITLREERDKNIFERLKQFGYEPEVVHFGRYAIRESRISLFNTTKRLMDKEWNRIWLEWLDTMKNFRLQRLEKTVFQSRRAALVEEYEYYVKHRSEKTPSVDLLPHVADVACFPPFRDIIRTPEEPSEEDYLFDSAFEELPKYADEWRKKLDIEVAELVKIPSHLSASSSAGDSKSSQAPTDKLHLACALFSAGNVGLFTHPDVFSTCMTRYKYPGPAENDLERTGSIRERFGIEYQEKAPYVVHACGLDPNVATPEDMDRRDARLQCLACQGTRFYDWREAIWHARSHPISQMAWQLVDDDSQEMASIRAAELADPKRENKEVYWSRCLLCWHHVGDEEKFDKTEYHLMRFHKIHELRIKEGEHYLRVGKVAHCSVGKIKEDRGKSTFRFQVGWERLVPYQLRWY